MSNKILKRMTLKPFGGLANRMRAIDSALLISRKFDCSLSIFWEMSFELNCSFQRLFQPFENVEIKEYYRNGFAKRSIDFVTGNLEKAGINYPPGYAKYYSNQEVLKLNRQGFDFENIANYESVYISTVNRFYSGRESFRSFKPIPQLQQRIDEHCSDFGRHATGIHIRRSDNHHSVKYSPISGFIDMMKDELDKEPDTRFYLATDSPEDEGKLKKIFGNRIITHSKTLDRNSEKGIHDALIDLYCLSNTSRIMGSYFSSFSEVAAQINNINLIIVYKEPVR
jgi:hypothetical protein